jgi:hypothetical protein
LQKDNKESDSKYKYEEVLYGKYKYQSVYSIVPAIAKFVQLQRELDLGESDLTKFAIVVKNLLSKNKFSDAQKDEIIKRFKENNPDVESISDVISLFKPLAFAISDAIDNPEADVNDVIKEALEIPYSISKSIISKYEQDQINAKKIEEERLNKPKKMSKKEIKELEREELHNSFLLYSKEEFLLYSNQYADFLKIRNFEEFNESTINKLFYTFLEEKTLLNRRIGRLKNLLYSKKTKHLVDDQIGPRVEIDFLRSELNELLEKFDQFIIMRSAYYMLKENKNQDSINLEIKLSGDIKQTEAEDC